MFAVWLMTWMPLCAHLSSFAPLIFYTEATPPTMHASMMSTSTRPSSYHFSASDTESDELYSELGYPLDIGTLHAFFVLSAASSHDTPAAREAARLKRPRRRAMKRLGKGSLALRITTKPVKWFSRQPRSNGEHEFNAQHDHQAFRAPLVVTTHAAKTGQVPLTVRGKHPRLPIPSVFYDESVMGRRVKLPEVGELPSLPSPIQPNEVKMETAEADDHILLPYTSRSCLDSVDPETRAAFDDLMVDLTRHPSVKLADPTTPPLRSVGSFAELAKKLTDRTRAALDKAQGDSPTSPASRHVRAPPPPPIPTEEVNLHFASLASQPDRELVSPRSTHSSLRRRKPRPSSGISESTDWSGTGSSAAAPLTNASRTSSRAPTMDSGYFPGSPPTLPSSASTSGSASFSSSGAAAAAAPGSPTSSIPPVPVVPAWILANPSIFPPGPGSDMGSCSIATDVRPDSPDVRIEYAFDTDYPTWVHHWKDLAHDTPFDQALHIGFRMPAGALGVKQVVTTGVPTAKKHVDDDRRSSISVLRRFSNVSLASVTHAIRHPVDTVLGHGHESLRRGSLTPASSNASLRSSVLGSGYHPSARPSVDGGSSVASTVKSRKSLLERLKFGSLGSRRSSFLVSGSMSATPLATTPIEETDESEWSTATAPPGPVDANDGKSSKLARKWSQRGKAARKRLSKVFGSFGFGGGGHGEASTSSGDERNGAAEADTEDEDNVPLAQVMRRTPSSLSITVPSRASLTLPRQPPTPTASASLRGTLPRSTTGSMSLRAMYTAGPTTPAPAIASTTSTVAQGTGTAAALAQLTMRAAGGTLSDFGGRGSAMEPFSDEEDVDPQPLVTSTLDRSGRTPTCLPPPPKVVRSLSRATQRTWTSRRTGSVGTPATPKSAYFPSSISVSAVSLASGGTFKTSADEPHKIRRSVVLTEDVDVWTIRISLTPNVCS